MGHLVPITYIYYRFIVRFPIELDFLFITLLERACIGAAFSSWCPYGRQPHAWDAICVMYLTSMWQILLMTDGLNAVWSNDCAALTDTNLKNVELAPPQSITATRLDPLVYSPNYYIHIFRRNLLSAVRIEPSTARSKLKSNTLTDCAMGAI